MPDLNQLGMAVRPKTLRTLKLNKNCSETLIQKSDQHRAMPGPNHLGMAVRPVALNTQKKNNNSSQTFMQKIG